MAGRQRSRTSRLRPGRSHAHRSPSSPSALALTATGIGAVLRRPDLWPTALSTFADLVPDRWWRRSPFLPLPDRDWLRFRLVTAYGGDGRFNAADPVRSEDLITFLEWHKQFPG